MKRWRRRSRLRRRVCAAKIVLRIYGHDILGPMNFEEFYLMVKWGGHSGEDLLTEALHNQNHLSLVVTIPD